MSNPYFNATGNPLFLSRGASTLISTEFASIGEAFDLIAAAGGAQIGTEAQGATVNDYNITLSPAPTAYAVPFGLSFKATHTNTGAAQAKVVGLAYLPIKNVDGAALSASDIISGAIVQLVYDGTNLYLVSGNDRANKNGELYAGTHDFRAAVVDFLTQAPFDNSIKAATTAYADNAVDVASQGSVGSSTTSLTIGIGSQSLTATTGKQWYPGQAMQLFNSNGNQMVGQVTAYNSSTGAMTFASQTITGSGTYASWSIGPPSNAGYSDDALAAAYYFS